MKIIGRLSASLGLLWAFAGCNEMAAGDETTDVMTAEGAKPAMYRVRIGKFKTKREAETVAARLQKEEQFRPWITR